MCDVPRPSFILEALDCLSLIVSVYIELIFTLDSSPFFLYEVDTLGILSIAYVCERVYCGSEDLWRTVVVM